MVERADFSRSRAILIGTATYQDSAFLPLPAAANSLNRMQEVLTDPGLCGWPEERVTALPDPRGAPELVKIIRRLTRSTEDVLLVYFVGHGKVLRRGRLCLVLSSTDDEDPDVTGLDYHWIRDALQESRARVKIVILDCCYSGRAIETLSSSASLSTEVADSTEIRGAFILTASDQAAHVPPLEEQATAATSFTDELLGLIRNGVPAGPELLTLNLLYRALLPRLESRGLPAANRRGTETVDEFAFTVNAAYGHPPQLISHGVPAGTHRGIFPSASPEESYNWGLAALYTKRWDSAVRAFGEVVRLDPTYKNATALLEEVRRQRHLASLYAEGLRAIERGDLNLAVEKLVAVLNIDPHYKAAQQELDKILPHSPAALKAHSEEALQHMNAGRWEEAFASLAAIRQMEPENKVLSDLTPRAARGLMGWIQDRRPHVFRPELMGTISTQGKIRTISFSPDSTSLAIARDKRAVLVVNLDGRPRIQFLHNHFTYASDVDFSPDGRLLASGGGDHTARIWNVSTGEEMCRFNHKSSTVRSVAFSPDGTRLAIVASYGRRGLYSSKVVAGNLVGENLILDSRTGQEICKISGCEKGAAEIAFNPDGSELAICGVGNEVGIWDPWTGRYLRDLTHEYSVHDIAFGANGLLADARADRIARIWDASGGISLAEYGHPGKIYKVALSPHGLLATSCADKNVRIWDITSGEEIFRITHPKRIFAIAFSATGELLAVGGTDGIIQLWRLFGSG